MVMIRKFLFPVSNESCRVSLLLLAARLFFGILLLSHGIQKWNDFGMLSSVFPDPLHVGNNISLSLCIFAEVFCSLGFITGFFYRLALIPMIFNLLVAFFVIHAGAPFQVKELALIYLVTFIILYIAGPGKFSADHYFFAKKE
jgi:putative oxidoreductase